VPLGRPSARTTLPDGPASERGENETESEISHEFVYGTRNRVQGDTYGRVNEFAAKIVSSGVSPNRLKFEVALSNLELVTQLDLIPYDSNEAVIFLPFKTSIF
jgi:hypothetical protein